MYDISTAKEFVLYFEFNYDQDWCQVNALLVQ